MEKYYLAVDIGASSGRHILGCVKNGKIKLEEIYRFENNVKKDGENLCWDLSYLFQKIIEGLKICKEIGKIPCSMAIDTWGVDYVLLDKKDNILGKTYSYRDRRTEKMEKKLSEYITVYELYKKTGIQKQIFNTIYQLLESKYENPEMFEKAETFLMLPDYFNFLLTGIKKSEYTNATSTQLVNASEKQWDFELIGKLEFNRKIFLPLEKPGTVIGNFTEEISKRIGYNCKVIMTTSHDTASAIISVPETDIVDSVYISSGTWSLMGIELETPDCSKKSMELNFTNEGGYGYRFRFLKNITGLWLIQCVRNEIEKKFSFSELSKMAEKNQDFPSRINVDDIRFMAPESMIKEIRSFCAETGQKIPEEIGEIAAVIYHSISDRYDKIKKEIEDITGKKYNKIHIIGGGSNAEFLNRLTAIKTGNTVYAGPIEATATGNLLVRMIKNGEFENLEKAKKSVYESFEVKKFEPDVL